MDPNASIARGTECGAPQIPSVWIQDGRQVNKFPKLHPFGTKMAAGRTSSPNSIRLEPRWPPGEHKTPSRLNRRERVPPTFGHALEDMEEAHEEVLDLRLLQLVTAKQAAAQGGGRLVLGGRRHRTSVREGGGTTTTQFTSAGDSARVTSGRMISLKLFKLGDQINVLKSSQSFNL